MKCGNFSGSDFTLTATVKAQGMLWRKSQKAYERQVEDCWYIVTLGYERVFALMNSQKLCLHS